MVINTEIVVGYNNKLKQADLKHGFKLGITDWANITTKKWCPLLLGSGGETPSCSRNF